MRIDEQMHTAFQEEMGALEHFRLAYSLAHPSVGLERDDPDVKRLMEAMAFFGARSRLAAERHMLALRQRLFRQFFTYLLSPLPTMGLIQARPTGQCADALTLPCGSQFAVRLGDGRQAMARLLTDLRILPLTLISCTTLLRPDRGFRLLLRLRAPYARNDDVGLLRLHISHLHDFKDSLGILHALEQHLLRASVTYDGEVSETTTGLPCRVTFGLPDLPLTEGHDNEGGHPIERQRLSIHFPQRELFVNLELAPCPNSWTTATLCLDLDEQWPRELILNRDLFQLFVAPVANLKSDFAQPLTCPGTRERHALVHPQPEQGYVLHSIRGVYELQKQGMRPLRPGIFAGGNGTYEIDHSTVSGREPPWLVLNFPEAFEHPRRIAVEALWHQPWLDAAMHRGGRILPFSRQTIGVDWQWAGSLVPHRDNPFLTRYDGFIQLLTLMNKTTLNLEDVKVLLDAVGMGEGSCYGEALRLLVEVDCQQAPRRTSHGGMMVKQVYRFVFREQGQGLQPLLASFTRHAERILDAWVADRVVEVEMGTTAVADPQGQHP